MIAEAALAEMGRWRIAPTPSNYIVWYNYVGGPHQPLRQAIDEIIKRDGAFPENVCIDLYERFFDVDQTETLRQLAVEIEGSVTRAAGTLANAGVKARQYGQSLGNSALSLAGEPGSTQVKEIVRQVLTETQAMIDRSETLERQLMKSTAEIDELRKQVELASREALTDGLTGIANRKMFDSRMKQLVQAASVSGEPLCLIMLDIDHFKAFNDNFGHQFGDLVLRLVARALADGVRQTDQVARYGGEEFAIILPDTSLDDAFAIGDLIRARIGSKPIVMRDSRRNLGNVTLSAGVACYRSGDTVQAVIKRADAALYQAKRSGRDRVLTERDIGAEDDESAAAEQPIAAMAARG
jgi:diguanylate cyclase